MEYVQVSAKAVPTWTVSPGRLAQLGLRQIFSRQIIRQTLTERLRQMYDLRPSTSVSMMLSAQERRLKFKKEAGLPILTASWKLISGNVILARSFPEMERKAQRDMEDDEWDEYGFNLISLYMERGLKSKFRNHSLSNRKRNRGNLQYSSNWKGFWSFRAKIDEEGEQIRKDLRKEGKERESQEYQTKTMPCIYRLFKSPQKLLVLAAIGLHDQVYSINPDDLSWMFKEDVED